jgi:deoxycytidylate deaminase
MIHRISDSAIPDRIRNILSKTIQNTNIVHDHIAIVTYKNRIVAIGRNLVNKTHPIQAKFANQAKLHHKQFLHAEIAVLIKSRQKIDTMYVFRIGKNGSLMNSKPCPICQLAINEALLTCYHS